MQLQESTAIIILNTDSSIIAFSIRAPRYMPEAPRYVALALRYEDLAPIYVYLAPR